MIKRGGKAIMDDFELFGKIEDFMGLTEEREKKNVK